MRKFKLWNSNMSNSLDLSSKKYLVSDVTGLGNNFTLNKIQNKVSGITPEFGTIQMQINFGINSNAYLNYNEFMNFIESNKEDTLILEYSFDDSIPIRYCDIYLKSSPKSQKTSFNILQETFVFERVTLWYNLELKTNQNNVEVINNTTQDIPVNLTIVEEANNKTIFIKDELDNIISETKITAPQFSLPGTVYIDSVKKKATHTKGVTTSIYQYLDKTKNTFIYVPKGKFYLSISSTEGFLTYRWEIKRWIYD